MALFDAVTVKKEKIAAEQKELKKLALQRISELESIMNRVDLFGLAMYQEFLSGAGLVDMDDLTQAAIDFNAQAASIAAINAKVIAIGEVKADDPAVFVANIQNRITSNGLESALVDYKTRFEV